jgi:hypothetical protein
MDWESAFIGGGGVLGEPVEVVRASVGPTSRARAARRRSRLEAPSREARAQALARVLAGVAVALEDARLA